MTRHAHPTLPDDRTRDTVHPTDQSELGEWDVAAERDLISNDEPALAEADHQILADDDLDDDDEDVEDLDEEDDADPEEEDEDGADDEDDEDFDEDDEDEEDAEEDEEVDEK
jgi:hypothetical protein